MFGVTNCGIPSLNTNNTLKNFIASKRLTLNEEKCHKFHMGRHEIICQKLSVNQSEMKQVTQIKYLRDILTSDLKYDENVMMRNLKGKSVVNTITNIMKELPIEQFYFRMALLFRISLLINSISFNMEGIPKYRYKTDSLTNLHSHNSKKLS